MPGSVGVPDFGHYQMQRFLGRGGMGEVYLARDTALGRDVAIKFVTAGHAGDADARSRFVREAQAAAGLDHPCICAVHEVGLAPDGRPYIAMAYADGTPLSELLLHGPLPVRQALELCKQVADALALAHHKQIVHRDLKPSNVMVTSSGRPKLLDFGIAKVIATTGATGETSTITTGTVSGALVGSPPYMSPEQVQQRRLDGRSDLFSLGAVLYECLTGVRAFDGQSTLEAVANVLHVDPVAPSKHRPELTPRHDALCMRLLAKDPNDRFQSAEEVIGALKLLTPDTGVITGPSQGIDLVPPPGPSDGRLRYPARIAGLVVASVALLGGGWWWTRHMDDLPSVPPAAEVWYTKGTEALRDGAYQTARKNLEEAVRLFPRYALAYARLADADAELDDERAAQKRLIRLSQLVPDESRLPEDERVRLQAIRALILRDSDAVAAYRTLADRHPHDPGAWVDLGRVQELGGSRNDARDSYQQAIVRDRRYASAYLRLGALEGAALNTTDALRAFAEAERLYRTSSNAEGEIEVLLRRGAMLDASNDVKAARVDLTRALTLATDISSTYQLIRAHLSLSSVTATEGRFAESERIATSAVQEAVTAGLDTVAADGLVDLTATLVDLDRLDDADAQVHRAIQLATNSGARRLQARANLQLAELRRLQDRASECVGIINNTLPFVRANRYRRLELFGLLIAARAHEQLGQLEQSSQMSSEVLRLAESLNDEVRVALAASDLAAVTTKLGGYPEALRLREKAEAIYRRLGDQSALPYTLANHADLLIRLGHLEVADRLLSELEKGIGEGRQAYLGLANRAAFLRAYAAATALRCDDAESALANVARTPGATDSTLLLAPAVGAFCQARLRQHQPTIPLPSGSADATTLAERQYWLAAADLRRGNLPAAAVAAREGLTNLGTGPNDEVRWRLYAILAAAADRRGERDQLSSRTAAARDALERVRVRYGRDFETYRKRADLLDLQRIVGQS